MYFRTLAFAVLAFVATEAPSNANSNEWSEGVNIGPGGRKNPLQLSEQEYDVFVRQGKIHAQEYPVQSTGILPPYHPVKNFLEEETANPLKALFRNLFEGFSGIKKFNDVLVAIGLHPYPLETDTGVYSVPYPKGVRPNYHMGFGLIETQNGTGFTLSCAACHSANLFGKTVLGMTNRFPRSNEAFIKGKFAASIINPTLFQIYNHASDGETQMIRNLRSNAKSLGLKRPLLLGLDTSLAQVALSLNHRNEDEYASKNRLTEIFPRTDLLDDFPADSKPAVWWNLKYKNRWLSDGSVVSGNPVLTNILWNEIGRGSDLQELNNWVKANTQTIEELTSAVFSIEAPLFTDFFSPEKINLSEAKRGEKIYLVTCAKCHGVYEKAWNQKDADQLPLVEQLKTTLVRYHEKTPVINVGTDPNRYLGMKSLEKKLNPLAFAKENSVVTKAQKGYVPPPLVGIWARWPYFHNNSAPTLCAVLTRHSERPKQYYAGEANDTSTDFDANCNGYPLGEQTPKKWKSAQYRYDTSREGLRNTGHDEGIFIKNGKEILSTEDKQALVSFMKTL